jgi:hypothetical protein
LEYGGYAAALKAAARPPHSKKKWTRAKLKIKCGNFPKAGA